MNAGIFIGIIIGTACSWVLLEAHWRWVDRRSAGLNKEAE